MNSICKSIELYHSQKLNIKFRNACLCNALQGRYISAIISSVSLCAACIHFSVSINASYLDNISCIRSINYKLAKSNYLYKSAWDIEHL